MRYALLNLLACPMCKHFPLELYVFEARRESRKFEIKKPFCDYYCGYLRKYIKDLNNEELPCDECLRTEIMAGVLVCPRCGRWYPIIESIPLMYPDKMRSHPRIKARERDFVLTYRDKYPELFQKILKNYNPTA